MLWHIELKFCIWLCFTVLQIKFECRHLPLTFVGVKPLLELRILKIRTLPHFSFTCFDILSWNFAYDFVLQYYRSTPSVVNWHLFCGSFDPFGTKNTKNTQFSALFSNMLWQIELKLFIWPCFTVLQIKFECRPFLWQLCPFGNLEYWQYIVIRTFLLDALTYWVEILRMTLVLNLRQFLYEQYPFIHFAFDMTLKYWKYKVFRTFLLHVLTYWAESFHVTFFYCTTDQVRVTSICVNFCRSYAPFGT